MPHRSEPALLMLHALHLKGVAGVEAVSEAANRPPAEVVAELQALATDGLVERREGALAGWTLTPEGRETHAQLLAAETAVDAVRRRVQAAYGRFRSLNPDVLEVCSRWQVRSSAGRLVLNDHSDDGYDAAVVHELGALHGHAKPVCTRLGATLERYRPYGPRLDHALERVRAGELDYFTKPVIPSYHTVWFELHEDLLTTLGLHRSTEAAP